MASEDNGSPAEAASVGVSKKAAKKAAQKAEKELRQQMAAVTVAKEEEDSLAANFGDLPFEALQSKEITGRIWTPVSQLEARFNGETVLIRGRAHSIRGKGKIAFVIVREAGCSVQCVLSAGEHVSKGMLKFVNSINKESFVDVQGVVSVPDVSIEATSQQVEIQVRKIYCVSKAAPMLPFSLEDAARSESDIQKAAEVGRGSVCASFARHTTQQPSC